MTAVTRRLTAWLVSLAALVVALAGCGGVAVLSYPPPPASAPEASASAATTVDLSRVVQAKVPGGATTTTPVIGPGEATIIGTVLGPAGPVAGATVRAERLVGDLSAATEATTAADGSFSIAGVLGGRYRVRAWQPPSLDLIDPQIFFLGANSNRDVTLQLSSYTGPQVVSSLAPTRPSVGQPANLVLQVTTPTVGFDGVVRSVPSVGVSVQLTGGLGWQVSGPALLTTSPAGSALFAVSCQLPGPAAVAVSVAGGMPTLVQMPTCSPAPTTTSTSVTPAGSPTSTSSGGNPTPTSPGGTSPTPSSVP